VVFSAEAATRRPRIKNDEFAGQIEMFIVRQTPIGEKDDYDGEIRALGKSQDFSIRFVMCGTNI